MIAPETVRARFAEVFGKEPRSVAFAPGRVNLIGEHIDYVRGWVLPCAISEGISVAAAPAASDTSRVLSINYADYGAVTFSQADSGLKHFAAFAQAVIYELQAPPMDLLVWGDLPVAAGLSSSAALCVAMVCAITSSCGGYRLPDCIALIQLCQQAETVASGTACGLMDQYASVYGAAGYALLLDTRSMTHEALELKLGDCELVVIDSGQPRELGGGDYNRRRNELADGFAELRRRFAITDSFRNHPWEQLLELALQLEQPGSRRLKHVITEQHRVEQFAAALRGGDTAQMGKLLYETHISLSKNFEVSTPEIDKLAYLLSLEESILGARIMGGGFGGSVLALVECTGLDSTVNAVLQEYADITGLTGRWLKVEPCDGARIWHADETALPVTEWLS